MTTPTPPLTPEELEATATRVLYELLGRRWVWPEVTTTELHDITGGQVAIRLEGRPVRHIESVRYEGTTQDVAYSLEGGHVVRLGKPIHSPLCGGTPARRIEVRYTYGSEPPLEVQQAIRVLADELAKAASGDSSCRLPERVTTISRQGITMTVLDSQEFLDQGKTGLPDVDAAIRHFNPSRAVRPARVFGRMTPPPTRTSTTQATP